MNGQNRLVLLGLDFFIIGVSCGGLGIIGWLLGVFFPQIMLLVIKVTTYIFLISFIFITIGFVLLGIHFLKR